MKKMDSTKKVYCINCEYVIIYNLDDNKASCQHPDNITYVDTPLYKQPLYKDLYKFNGKNDCPKFEQKETIGSEYKYG